MRLSAVTGWRGTLEETLALYDAKSGDVVLFSLSPYQFRNFTLEMGARVTRDDMLRGMARTTMGTPVIRSADKETGLGAGLADGIYAIHGEVPGL